MLRKKRQVLSLVLFLVPINGISAVAKLFSAGKTQKIIYTLLTALTFLGCQGGGESAPAISAPAPNPAGSVTISGVALKGPISGGDVKVYAVKNGQVDTSAVLGLGKTAADGSYSVTLVSTPTGPVVVEVSGGIYTDEASGTPGVPLKTPLRAAVASVTDGAQIAVTPLTHLACKQVEGIGAYTDIEIDDANVQVARFFEVADIIASLPFDPTQPAPLGASNDRKRYAAALGVFSQLVNNKKGSQTLGDATVTVLAQLEGELKNNGGFSLATIGDVNVAITGFAASGKNRGGLLLQPVAFAGGVLQLSTEGVLPAGAVIKGIDYTVTLPAGVTVKADAGTGETEPGVVVPVSLAASKSMIAARFDKAANSVRIILVNVQPGFAVGEFAHLEFDGFPVNGADFTVKVNRIDGGSGTASTPLTGLTVRHTFAGL